MFYKKIFNLKRKLKKIAILMTVIGQTKSIYVIQTKIPDTDKKTSLGKIFSAK